MQVKQFKDTFCKTGRLDAEYYQGKYDELNNLKISSYTIKDVCKIKDKNFTPNNELEYKYIELSNIGSCGEIEGVETILGVDLPSRARRRVNTGDVIVSSIEGSLQSCALITNEFDNALCSTGFYVINSEKINSETLLVLMKSRFIQSFMKRGCSGTILTNISKDEFLNIQIPVVSTKIQCEIKKSITSFYALKHESQALLTLAKRAVEIAIEKGQGAAIAMINERFTA